MEADLRRLNERGCRRSAPQDSFSAAPTPSSVTDSLTSNKVQQTRAVNNTTSPKRTRCCVPPDCGMDNTPGPCR
eukprot:1046425-Rhodomonas_salina.2